MLGGSHLAWKKAGGGCPFEKFHDWVTGGGDNTSMNNWHRHNQHHHGHHHREDWQKFRACHEECEPHNMECHHACPKPWAALEEKCEEHKKIKACHEECPHHDFFCHMSCPMPKEMMEHPEKVAKKMQKKVKCHLECGMDKACHASCPKAWCKKLEEKCAAFETIHSCHEKCGCPWAHPEARACHHQCSRMPELMMEADQKHEHHHNHEEAFQEEVHACHEHCGWDVECHFNCPRREGGNGHHHHHVMKEFMQKLKGFII